MLKTSLRSYFFSKFTIELKARIFRIGSKTWFMSKKHRLRSVDGKRFPLGQALVVRVSGVHGASREIIHLNAGERIPLLTEHGRNAGSKKCESFSHDGTNVNRYLPNI
jgi:hypothetical protein